MIAPGPALVARAAEFIAGCTRAKLTVAVGESCTGGLLSALLTDVPGASAAVKLGVVTYSNEAKVSILKVPQHALDEHGAVSAQVALAMAQGALAAGDAHLAAGITGIAGPLSDNTSKPVGLVYIAAVRRGRQPSVQRFQFGAIGRDKVRAESVAAALAMLESLLQAT